MRYPQKSPYLSTKIKLLKFRDFFYSFEECNLHKEILSTSCTTPILNKLPNQCIWKVSGACTTYKKAERFFYNSCPQVLAKHTWQETKDWKREQIFYLEFFFPISLNIHCSEFLVPHKNQPYCQAFNRSSLLW